MVEYMRFVRFISCCILCLLSIGGQAKGKEKVKFAYDVDFVMNFDNREFYRSDFSSSMTIFGARLTPSVGLDIRQNRKTSHHLMIGIDVMKDFGAPRQNLDLLQEVTMYYRLDKSFGDTDMTLTTGIFPRSEMSGRYSQAFFSDSLKFYDNNLEGLLLKFRRPHAEFEVGCDWMGQYGDNCRERFMIFSSGEGKVAPVLDLGYSAYMYHFANSWQVCGVVDNILLNPYLRLDLENLLPFQEFSLKLGWLQALQHDRKHVGHYVFPGGGEFDITLRKWNVGASNRFFCGTDMMPYYNSFDSGNIKYGTQLYMGDPFYRVHDDGKNGVGTYDRVDVFYEPFIGRMLKIRIAAMFHFNNLRYSGCQQVVSVCFNLN